jgi:hypothetical protein
MRVTAFISNQSVLHDGLNSTATVHDGQMTSLNIGAQRQLSLMAGLTWLSSTACVCQRLPLFGAALCWQHWTLPVNLSAVRGLLALLTA